jgi:hypothetical protein
MPNKITLSKAGNEALRLLTLPKPRLEQHTPYERPDTPYFMDVCEQIPDTVTVVVSSARRYGSAYGDSDHWDRNEECVLPAVLFYELLAGLEGGKQASAEMMADIVKTDRAWGIDCVNPYDSVTHEEVRVSLTIEMSPDLKTVTLTLLRCKGNGFVPYATLQRSEIAQ